ncbi:MAG: dihydropteroate synthase [Candidatus Omnitrophica bacterium]|nr:dihydropteroate synthase [Candidatus Omnitrophota bacterium]
MRILDLSSQKELTALMKKMNVDNYGIKIMLPKAQSRLLKINSLSNTSANILKQEMLSLGGDVAISRDALTGKVKKTDCLVMGNLSQLYHLSNKLKKQPFGLNSIAEDISVVLENSQKNKFMLKAGKYELNLSNSSCIMGIINITNDSFSGDGFLNLSHSNVIKYAMRLIKDGADIIDVGGESSRPGARPVSLKEETKRVIPIIKLLVKNVTIPVSIDTYKPELAKMALDCGVSIVNDISGLRNPNMAKIISRYKAAIVIMHMLKKPVNMQLGPNYGSLIDEIALYLKKAVDKATEAGINAKSIIIDPGIGFGKTLQHNLEIIKRLREFKSLGKPILIGTSRKTFIGNLLNLGPKDRVFGTVSSCVHTRINGANIFRVHDVKAVREALTITDNINK